MNLWPPAHPQGPHKSVNDQFIWTRCVGAGKHLMSGSHSTISAFRNERRATEIRISQKMKMQVSEVLRNATTQPDYSVSTPGGTTNSKYQLGPRGQSVRWPKWVPHRLTKPLSRLLWNPMQSNNTEEKVIRPKPFSPQHCTGGRQDITRLHCYDSVWALFSFFWFYFFLVLQSEDKSRNK